jgi:hypothetical protein
MITRRLAILSLLALAGPRMTAQELPAAGGVEVRGSSSPSDLEMRPVAVAISAQDSLAVSRSVRRYLPRRKERPAWRPTRREWGVPARFNVIEVSEPLRLAELAPGNRFSFIFNTLGRIRDDDRGPPSS